MKKIFQLSGLILISLSLVHCKKSLSTKNAKEISTIALSNKPNVLLIIVDDLRFYSIGRLYEEAGKDPADPVHGNRGHSNNMVPKTPHIDNLIDGGNSVTFLNANASATECCPSRTAFLFGKYPHESGVYRNGNHWWTAVTDDQALTRQFVQDSKYKVFGAGKIFHGSPNDEGKYFNVGSATGPYNNFFETNTGIDNSGNYTAGGPSVSKNGYGSQIINLNNPQNDFSNNIATNVTQDAKAVSFCINKMQNVINQNEGLPSGSQSSFFVTCGIRRPHSKLIVPQNYYDNAGPAVTPKVLPANISGLPDVAKALINSSPFTSPDDFRDQNPTGWDNYLQAYAGAVSYMDDQVGRLIDFIDADPVLKANTIIVLVSDNGVHLGDKHHVHKTTLYEETTRIPMIWRVPGQGANNNKFCDVPVDLMSLYPTLMDYCNLNASSGISGRNIKNLINSPGTLPAESPIGNDYALTEMDQESSSIRSYKHRFIQYKNGGDNNHELDQEEIYNHRGTSFSFDPWEARNLRANNPPFLDLLRNKKNDVIPSWTKMVDGDPNGDD